MNSALLCALLVVFLLVGCQPNNTPSTHPFVVGHSHVFLHKSHLMAVKTELYTPSFALQGVILPKQEHNVVAQSTGKLTELLVQPHEQVDEGQTLAWFVTEHTPDDTKQSDDSLPLDDTKQDENDPPLVVSSPPYAITTPITGTVHQLYAHTGDLLQKDSVLMTISDERLYHFVSVLPAAFDKHISVGDHVSFAITTDQHTPKDHDPHFAGQVAQTALSDDKTQLSVTVHIIPEHDTPLTKGLQVSGWIDYGDLSIGAVVPAAAFADGVNLNALTYPPYKPATPTPAHVWVVRQDGTLSLTPVHIVAYKPAQQRYLVTGISGDSLIVSANLPRHADGMPVSVR